MFCLFDDSFLCFLPFLNVREGKKNVLWGVCWMGMVNEGERMLTKHSSEVILFTGLSDSFERWQHDSQWPWNLWDWLPCFQVMWPSILFPSCFVVSESWQDGCQMSPPLTLVMDPGHSLRVCQNGDRSKLLQLNESFRGYYRYLRTWLFRVRVFKDLIKLKWSQ